MEGRERILVISFGYGLVIRTFKNHAQLPFFPPLLNPISKKTLKEYSEKHFRMYTSTLAKLWAWWVLCFQI
jgi:hypothetical protein